MIRKIITYNYVVIFRSFPGYLNHVRRAGDMVVFIHCPEIYDLKEARKYTGLLHRAKQFSVKLRFFLLIHQFKHVF